MVWYGMPNVCTYIQNKWYTLSINVTASTGLFMCQVNLPIFRPRLFYFVFLFTFNHPIPADIPHGLPFRLALSFPPLESNSALFTIRRSPEPDFKHLITRETAWKRYIVLAFETCLELWYINIYRYIRIFFIYLLFVEQGWAGVVLRKLVDGVVSFYCWPTEERKENHPSMCCIGAHMMNH